MAKYKVGDKVRVRSDLVVGKAYSGKGFVPRMKEHLGQIVTIKCLDADCVEYYQILEDSIKFQWTDEMFEGLAEEEYHMSAEEVLQWLKDNYEGGNYRKCFGRDYLINELFNVSVCNNSKMSMSEIVSKIEGYERNKKQKEKEIETEFRYVFRIIEDTKDKKVCVEEKLTNCSVMTLSGECDMASEYLKEYCKTHEGNFFCSVERNCYVKDTSRE